MADKLKFAFYWNASCGGCEVAVLDIHEKILDVAAIADILMWPVAMDFKEEDVEALPDQHIDVAFINGGIRNSENKKMSQLLRQKSKYVVAFGACANFGGIPALANFHHKESIFDRVYSETPSTVNPKGVWPQEITEVPEGELSLPTFFNTVYMLAEVVDVDYYLPGCPPPPDLILAAVGVIASGNLPPKGTVIAGEKSVCHSCDRVKEEKKVTGFNRIHEVIPDPERCFLEQGIICAGSVTRDGCGTRCLNVDMPCRGCFGAPEEVIDQGAQLLSTLTTLLDTDDLEEVRSIIGSIPDLSGYLYRFTLSDSLMKRRIVAELKDKEVASH